MLYNSTYYRTSDIETIVNAVYETLQALAPNGRTGMVKDYHHHYDTLRFHVPENFIVGMHGSQTPQCWQGYKCQTDRDTVHIQLPFRQYAYEHDLQRLGMTGLFPDVKGLVRAILRMALGSMGKLVQKEWIEKVKKQSAFDEAVERHVLDCMAAHVVAKHPHLQLHIDKKANSQDLKACRLFRASLRLEEAEERLRARTSRLLHAEWITKIRKEQVETSQTQVAKYQATVAKLAANA